MATKPNVSGRGARYLGSDLELSGGVRIKNQIPDALIVGSGGHLSSAQLSH